MLALSACMWVVENSIVATVQARRQAVYRRIVSIVSVKGEAKPARASAASRGMLRTSEMQDARCHKYPLLLAYFTSPKHLLLKHLYVYLSFEHERTY